MADSISAAWLGAARNGAKAVWQKAVVLAPRATWGRVRTSSFEPEKDRNFLAKDGASVAIWTPVGEASMARKLSLESKPSAAKNALSCNWSSACIEGAEPWPSILATILWVLDDGLLGIGWPC